jgi:FMN hydrolase / 5-amino-6-(5-phospho-D-ribitylamino)uracil phosphatase
MKPRNLLKLRHIIFMQAHFDFSQIQGISLDLDDTLWPIMPVLHRAELVLHAWFEANFPEVALAYPAAKMRELRASVWQQNPDLAHDFTELRRMALAHAMRPLGCSEHDVEAAIEVVHTARNQVTLFADAQSALPRLSAKFPLVALTNGNADLHRIGLAQHFKRNINAREFGKAKPEIGIFHAACHALGLAPAQVLHIGDHPEQDVLGAQNAGMPAVWVNRSEISWTEALVASQSGEYSRSDASLLQKRNFFTCAQLTELLAPLQC